MLATIASEKFSQSLVVPSSSSLGLHSAISSTDEEEGAELLLELCVNQVNFLTLVRFKYLWDEGVVLLRAHVLYS